MTSMRWMDLGQYQTIYKLWFDLLQSMICKQLVFVSNLPGLVSNFRTQLHGPQTMPCTTVRSPKNNDNSKDSK